MKTKGYRGLKGWGATKKDKETHPEDDAVEMMGEILILIHLQKKGIMSR